PIKVQLGPLANGLVIGESFVRAPPFEFPGVADLFNRYQVKAAGQGVDPLGYGFVPFDYAAGQGLAQAVEATKNTNDDKLAAYIPANTFKTVVRGISFGMGREWAKT